MLSIAVYNSGSGFVAPGIWGTRVGEYVHSSMIQGHHNPRKTLKRLRDAYPHRGGAFCVVSDPVFVMQPSDMLSMSTEMTLSSLNTRLLERHLKQQHLLE